VSADWSITDEVVRLRQWGTDRTYPLPSAPVAECLIGSSSECSFRLNDDRVSRKHARMTRVHGRWSIVDLGSKNGLRADGARQYEPFVIEPGIEIGIGGLALIAESDRWILLRSFCERILGWTSDRAGAVDQMLRSVRLAARMRTPLLLDGESDLVPVAHSLHRYTHGGLRPFITCDPRRRDVEKSARAVENHELGLVALEVARGGTLCVRGERPPSDYAELLRRIHAPDARVQLIVCSRTRSSGHPAANAPIRVPPLGRRPKEVSRIVDEYIQDAIAVLKPPRAVLTHSDRAWIVEHAATTLPEIEKAALRLVALRASGNIARAAARLGMAPISLARWIDRRRPPMHGRPGFGQ
jgi:hypothetical protein